MSNFTNVTMAYTDANVDVSLTSKVIEVLVLVILCAVASVGNVSLWIIVLQNKGLRTMTSMFILGLSLAGQWHKR